MTTSGRRYFKRNFLLGVVTGALLNVGMAFIDPVIVLPLFVTRLGGSAILIGFISALHGVGWFLPQIFVSGLAVSRARVLPVYRVLTGVRSIALGGVVLTLFFVDPRQTGVFLAVFAGLLLVTHLSGGLAAIPFLEVTSKTIPVTRRGRFFGLRRLIGGGVGVMAGMIVGLVLDERGERTFMSGPLFDALEVIARRLNLLGHVFPTDFGVLFLCAWVFLSLGMMSFCFAGEPPAAKVSAPKPIASHIRSGLRLLREDKDYRRFYYVRLMWQLTAMAFPFYAAFAYSELGLSATTLGLFLSVWVGSGIFSNTLWGWLLDTKGNRIVLVTTATLAMLPPLVVLVLHRFYDAAAGVHRGVLVAMCATFLLNGMIRSGRIITDVTYLLEFAPPEKRPLYVGFMNSASFPLMLSPLLGGVILESWGTPALYWTAFLCAVFGAWLTLRLPEPREPVRN